MAPQKKHGPRTTARVDRRWFLDRMESVGLTQRKLAEYLDVDESAVSLMLRGQRGMKVHEAGIIAKALNVPVGEVFKAAGVPMPDYGSGNTVPVKGWVDSLFNVHMKRPKSGARKVTAPVFDVPHLVAVRVMAPEIPSYQLGEAVLYYSDDADTPGVDPDCIGRLSIVKTATGWFLIRVVVREGKKRGQYTLHRTTDGAVEERVALEWGTPIMAIRPG